MSESSPAQNRPSTPFSLGVGFSGQYFLKDENPRPERPFVNKHELAVNMGRRWDVKNNEKNKSKYRSSSRNFEDYPIKHASTD